MTFQEILSLLGPGCIGGLIWLCGYYRGQTTIFRRLGKAAEENSDVAAVLAQCISRDSK